jgi:hypothetical protein
MFVFKLLPPKGGTLSAVSRQQPVDCTVKAFGVPALAGIFLKFLNVNLTLKA